MYCKSFLLKVLYKTLFSECFCQKNVTNQKYEEKSDSCVQRICISDRKHSTPLRLPTMCLTKPLPAGRIHRVHHSNYLTD